MAITKKVLAAAAKAGSRRTTGKKTATLEAKLKVAQKAEGVAEKAYNKAEKAYEKAEDALDKAITAVDRIQDQLRGSEPNY